MASNFHIQKPYVLATLPRSLALDDGRAVVGDVFGQRPGIKRRRRAEVVVGIDGESANIYDISAARLVTSYPVPPQAKFSCAPLSVRLRSSSSKDASVARYTYIATREPARKLSLFKDTADAAGTTASNTVMTSLGRMANIVSLHALSLAEDPIVVSATSPAAAVRAADLLAVSEDGQVACFDGESLKEKYTVSVAGLAQDLVPRGATLRVEFTQMGLAADAVKGLALGADYLTGVFAQPVGGDTGFNPDVLCIVTTVTGRQTAGQTAGARFLHILAVDPARSHGALVQVHHIRLPPPSLSSAPTKGTDGACTYRLDLSSGTLAVLEGDAVLSYDLTRSVPRVSSSLCIPGVTSFLRLSKSSVLASTPAALAVYNPLFQSLQASTTIDADSVTAGSQGPPPSSNHACSLVSFFPQLELVVALLDAQLVAVQLEPPRTRSKKRRADGLLIDAIGRGMAGGCGGSDSRLGETSASTLSKRYLPGSVAAGYMAQFRADVQRADDLLARNDVAAFDDMLANKLGIQALADWRWQRPLDARNGADDMDETPNGLTMTGGVLTNGNGRVSDKSADEAADAVASRREPATSGPKHAKYPETDRRWVVYAISRVVAVAAPRPGQRLRLRCAQPTSEILNYLVDAGHLSVANTHSALRGALRDVDVDEDESLLGEALPLMLAQVDPSLDLLLRWLYETKLAAAELLSAILLLMRSLELVASPDALSKRLTNGTTDGAKTADSPAQADADADADVDDEAADRIRDELDQLDQQLHLAEFFLEHVENDPRDLALDIAIGKLGSCPAATTVQGLRRIFGTDEIRALIEVLRKQMVDQGWASRYLDTDAAEAMETAATAADADASASTAPFNYSIRLIADLLGRCIDAVRPGEWLINDEERGGGAGVHTDGNGAATADAPIPEQVGGDFFALLKWQVSAALEGVQEALYLRGIVGETVRYGMGVQKMSAAPPPADAAKVRPQRVAAAADALPLGLKAPVGLGRLFADVAPAKVKAGGEVVRRTRRELGQLTSKKVGAYTLERIVF